MSADESVVDLAYTPPSLNKLGSRGSNFAWNRRKKDLQRDVELLLLADRGRRPFVPPVTATAVLRFPTSRGRDEGNYRAMLEKAVGDALQNGGWLPGDTPDLFRFGRVDFAAGTGPAATTITLRGGTS